MLRKLVQGPNGGSDGGKYGASSLMLYPLPDPTSLPQVPPTPRDAAP